MTTSISIGRAVGTVATLSLLAGLVAASARAQVEPGWAVYTRLHNPVNPPAAAIPGGIVVYHPYLGMNAEVTGLPASLTWVGRPGVGGANAVLVRDEEGSLLVSGIYGGLPAVIYDLALDGTVATVRRTYTIGVPTTSSSIDQMAWLPGNRVLFSHIGVAHPALQQPSGLGILDLTTGEVAGVPITDFPVGRTINACAVDPTFTTVYIGTFGGGGGVYAVPLNGGFGGPATAIPGLGTLSSSVQQLAVGHDGMLYLGPGFGIGKVLQIDPTTGNTVELVNVVGTLNALCVEPVTGDLVILRINAATTPVLPEGSSAAFYWRNPSEGLVQVLGMSGYESASGVAVRSSLLPYGSADARSTREWQVRPNPGGAPRRGNLGFTLTTTSSHSEHGVMCLALEPSSAPIRTLLMSNLLLDPSTFVGLGLLIPPAKSFTIPLPLPRQLPSLDLYAQAFSFVRGWPPLAGGPGLRIHVYD